MTPQAFTFKLSVPNDPAGAEVVAALAHHAAVYAHLDPAKGEAFVQRARAAAAAAMKAAGPGHSPVLFAAAGGTLTVTIGGESTSEPLPPEA